MHQRIQTTQGSGRGRVAMPIVFAFLLASAIVPGLAAGQEQPLKTIHVNGVELHYVDRGHGEPVIFIHGGLADYRMWEAQTAAFAQHYRTIAYSRRYNFPNTNRRLRPDYSWSVDAQDLAALIRRLKLGPVHLVGASAGAATALFLAVQHPELVRSLVLAEPPVHRWANDVPGGAAVFDEFMRNLWRPVGRAFCQGDSERALRISMEYFVGPGVWEQLPEEVKNVLRANQRDWQALTTSSDAFPHLSRRAVTRLPMPVLMLTGDQTLPIHQLVNDELERLVPNGQRVRFPDATHEIWDEFPEQARATTLTFLAAQ